MSRPLLNLLLVVLLVALVAVAYFRPGIEPESTTTLTDLSAAAIDIIEIRNARGEITLRREDDRWRIPALGIPADPTQMRVLTNLPTATSARRYTAAEVALDELGLKPPKATLAYNGTQILLGATEPLGDLRYVQHGDTVHLIQDKVLNLLQAEAADLASRSLIPHSGELERIELPAFSLTRRDNGGWTVEPERRDLSADQLQQIADAWQQTRALWIRPHQPRDAQGRVRLVFGGDDPAIEFELIRRADELILARPDLGVDYHLSPYHAERLLEPAAVRERDTPSAPEEIEPRAGKQGM